MLSGNVPSSRCLSKYSWVSRQILSHDRGDLLDVPNVECRRRARGFLAVSLIVKVRIRASFSSQYYGGLKKGMCVDIRCMNVRRGRKLLTRTLLTLHVEAEGLSKGASLSDSRFLAYGCSRRLLVLAALWTAPFLSRRPWDNRGCRAVPKSREVKPLLGGFNGNLSTRLRRYGFDFGVGLIAPDRDTG